jgi:hypothetical protein
MVVNKNKGGDDGLPAHGDSDNGERVAQLGDSSSGLAAVALPLYPPTTIIKALEPVAFLDQQTCFTRFEPERVKVSLFWGSQQSRRPHPDPPGHGGI